MTLPRSATGVPYRRDASGSAAPPPPDARLGLLGRAMLFLLLFALMQAVYGSARGTWIERLVIDRMTVETAAWLIDTFDPAVHVEAAGPRLRAPGGGLNVLNGCEGTEVVFLMVSAMLVAPLAWRRRLLGLVTGTLLVFTLNQARVLALFYAFRSDRGLFDMLHGVVAPLLLILAAAAFFVVWLDRSGGSMPGQQPV
jgi:exosortase/archaeosortase family protein